MDMSMGETVAWAPSTEGNTGGEFLMPPWKFDESISFVGGFISHDLMLVDEGSDLISVV